MGSFETLGIPDQVLRNIRLAGYRVPTDIQAQAIPVLLQGGMDAVISSETGSGKTAAFLIPGIVRYVEGRRRLLVLSPPTRELAIQTDRQAGTLGRGLLRHALVYGGAPMGRQVSDLSMGPGIVTGTPGRVLDLHRRGAIDLGAFDSVVLDECDTMLDMGFVEDVTEILSHASGRSQTSFVSATVTAPILSLISELGTDPVYIGLGRVSGTGGVPQSSTPMRLSGPAESSRPCWSI
ncbi:DEAD/DEAH box helicase [Thermogymnomonas acidicola]|uniref:DEAD/DEAH box helicase n=1 Tax=Thermogymnomonas acidicola TaxID=399579 RepID=UPI0009466452|nr:DEAD/DEAH box helicase [Thermogymnomonas acidicola]